MSECPRNRDEEIQSSGERYEYCCGGGAELQEANPPERSLSARRGRRSAGFGPQQPTRYFGDGRDQKSHDAEDGNGRQSQGPAPDRTDKAGSEWNTEDRLGQQIIGVPRDDGVQEQCVDDADNGGLDEDGRAAGGFRPLLHPRLR
ncbi:hypothetical protein GCM10009532_16090 [Microbacterium aurantiacum]